MHCHNMNVNSPSRIWDFLSTHANSEIAYFGQIFHGQNIERSEIQVHPVLSPQEPLPDEQQQKYFIHGFFFVYSFPGLQSHPKYSAVMWRKVPSIYTVVHLDQENPEANKDDEIASYAESISVTRSWT